MSLLAVSNRAQLPSLHASLLSSVCAGRRTGPACTHCAVQWAGTRVALESVGRFPCRSRNHQSKPLPDRTSHICLGLGEWDRKRPDFLRVIENITSTEKVTSSVTQIQITHSALVKATTAAARCTGTSSTTTVKPALPASVTGSLPAKVSPFPATKLMIAVNFPGPAYWWGVDSHRG